jgi:transcription termination/antitermination protein NusA
MNAEFLAILDFWEREKGIQKDVLVKAVEEALLSAAKKAVGPARDLRVVIDPKSGDIKAFARLIVAERVISKHDQISVFDARRIQPEAAGGRRDRERSHPGQLRPHRLPKRQAGAHAAPAPG